MKATILGFLFAAVITVPVVGQRTLAVDLDGSGEFTEIQAAIDVAADGDTVRVKPGEYVITEPIDFNRLHDPEDPESPPVKNLILRSEAGAEETVVRATVGEFGHHASFCFSRGETAESSVTAFMIVGPVIVRGRSAPTIGFCTIAESQGFSPVHGGGVGCLDEASPIFHDCTVSGSTSWTRTA